jgi:uncharacterized membrane protein
MTIRGPFAVTLLVALFVSLAVNLMIAGFIVTRFGGPPGGGDIERIVALGIRAFPPEIQGDIRVHVRSDRGMLHERIQAVQAARQQMFQAMRADPFDRAALDQDFANVREKTNDIQAIGQDIVASAIAQAPPDVRARIRPMRGPFP